MCVNCFRSQAELGGIILDQPEKALRTGKVKLKNYLDGKARFRLSATLGMRPPLFLHGHFAYHSVPAPVNTSRLPLPSPQGKPHRFAQHNMIV